MKWLQMPAFWVATLGGIALVILFFVASRLHHRREHYYSATSRSIEGKGPPPSPADIASAFLPTKRPFRSANLFYALALAYKLQ